MYKKYKVPVGELLPAQYFVADNPPALYMLTDGKWDNSIVVAVKVDDGRLVNFNRDAIVLMVSDNG